MARKKPFLLWLILMTALITAALILMFSGSGPRSDLKRYLGVDIGDSTVLRDEDTHGGFHGDGERFLVVDCAQNQESLLEQIAAWNSLPLTDNLSRAMAGSGFLPCLGQGRWYFIDRHSQSTRPQDDSELLNRYSRNFTLAVYDTEHHVLYYYELDT